LGFVVEKDCALCEREEMKFEMSVSRHSASKIREEKLGVNYGIGNV